MNILDNEQAIYKLDSRKICSSIDELPDQCLQAWEEVKSISFPKSYRNVSNILINGMGGSGLGGHLINSVFGKQLKVPLNVINSYDLPSYVNSKTLYIISSYSGSTEEPISTFNQARKKGAKIIIIASGDKLGKLAKRFKVPAYIFNPVHNPANSPRMGLGYSILGQVSFLAKLNLINIRSSQVTAIVSQMKKRVSQWNVEKKVAQNQAKKMAEQLHGRILITFASDHLAGNAHIFSNQLNESAKTFATYFLIPELNHHLLEGLRFPVKNRTALHFILFTSQLYRKRNQIRMNLTERIIKKHTIPTTRISIPSDNTFDQAMEMLLFCSYIGYYLSLLKNIDPFLIPWVDYFKRELAKVQ